MPFKPLITRDSGWFRPLELAASQSSRSLFKHYLLHYGKQFSRRPIGHLKIQSTCIRYLRDQAPIDMHAQRLQQGPVVEPDPVLAFDLRCNSRLSLFAH